MIKNSLVLAVIGCSLVMTSQAQAMAHKKKAAAPTENTVDASVSQDALIQSYSAAASLIAQAQEEFLLAYGMKDEAAALSETAKVLGSGSSLNKKEIKTVSKQSKSADKAIAEKIDSGEELNAEGKEHYVKALGFYAQGLLATQGMTNAAMAFPASALAQIADAPMMAKASMKSKLSVGTYVAKELPGYISSLTKGFTKAVSYAKSAGIPVPDEAASLL